MWVIAIAGHALNVVYNFLVSKDLLSIWVVMLIVIIGFIIYRNEKIRRLSSTISDASFWVDRLEKEEASTASLRDKLRQRNAELSLAKGKVDSIKAMLDYNQAHNGKCADCNLRPLIF